MNQDVNPDDDDQSENSDDQPQAPKDGLKKLGLTKKEATGINANVSWGSELDPEKLEEYSRYIMNARNLSGCFYPIARPGEGFVVDQRGTDDSDDLPMPPVDLWHAYGRTTNGGYDPAIYLAQGQHDVRNLKRIVGADGFNITDGNILDFGCSGGRMLRHFEAQAKTVECWGCDLHSAAMQWARIHMSPPFHFVLNTNAPHLPFTDGYFNLVYAGSVFSHIGEMDDAWFLELRRIIRPGGRLYFTFNDDHSLSSAQEKSPNHHWVGTSADFFDAKGMTERNWAFAVMGTTPWVQRVFYNREWLTKHLGAWFDIVSVEPHVYGWQSAMTLRVR